MAPRLSPAQVTLPVVVEVAGEAGARGSTSACAPFSLRRAPSGAVAAVAVTTDPSAPRVTLSAHITSLPND